MELVVNNTVSGTVDLTRYAALFRVAHLMHHEYPEGALQEEYKAFVNRFGGSVELVEARVRQIHARVFDSTLTPTRRDGSD